MRHSAYLLRNIARVQFAKPQYRFVPLCSLALPDRVSVKALLPDGATTTVNFGDFGIIASDVKTGRNFLTARNFDTESGLLEKKVGERVWVRGRVANRRAKGNLCFLVLRIGTFHTVQICRFIDANASDPEETRRMIDFMSSIPLESIVDIHGLVQSARVKSCSEKGAEIIVDKCFVVSRVPVVLPFTQEAAAVTIL